MNTADLLETCLEDVAAGRRTPAECAAAHPEVAELAQLLAAAELARDWRPPQWSAAASHRQLARIRAAGRPARRPALRLRPGLAWLLALMVCGAAGVSVVEAAAPSLPGQPLYVVKRAVESVTIVLASPDQRALVLASLAERRLNELERLTTTGAPDAALLSAVAGELEATTQAALRAAAAAPPHLAAQTWARLMHVTAVQDAALVNLRALTPPEAQTALDAAWLASHNGQAQADEQLSRPAGAAASPAAGPASASTLAAGEPARPVIQPPTSPGPFSASASEAAGGPAPVQATAELVTPAAPIQVPPGQAKQTEAPAVSLEPPSQVPPGQAKQTEAPAASPEPPTQVPPGQAKQTEAPAPSPEPPSQVPPGQAKQTEAPATPTPLSVITPLVETPAPTACPTNPGGQPKCKP